MADIERVLQEGVTVEAQTWDKRQRCLFLRILPYRARIEASTEGPFGAPVERSLSPDGVVLTLTDISALEHARARLAQLSAIVESSDDAIIGKTLDGVITTLEQRRVTALRLHGRRGDRPARELPLSAGPEGGDRRGPSAGPRRPSGRAAGNGSGCARTAVVVDVSVTFSPILDWSNTPSSASPAISRDITQLMRARQEIADREERIRLLLDSTAEAIYGIDLSGDLHLLQLGVRPAARLRVAGGAHRQADAPADSPHQARRHAVRAGAVADLPRRCGTATGAHVDDEVIWRADGTSFPAEYWSHPIFRNDEVIGAVVTFLDVTERRKAEEEIQEGVRRREQFLAMLSHELRNPLAAILSATRVLENASWTDDACHEAGQVVDAPGQPHVAAARRSARRRAHHARPDHAAQGADRPARHGAVRDRGARVRSWPNATPSCSIDMADEPLFVIGDAARLQQIQANLLSNASKYSPRGAQVRLRASPRGRPGHDPRAGRRPRHRARRCCRGSSICSSRAISRWRAPRAAWASA